MTLFRLGISPLRPATALTLSGVLAILGVLALLPSGPAFSQARGPAPSLNATIGDNFTGSYLAGRTASAEHDAESAATYFGRALRADPANVQLLASTFVYRLSNGDIEQALPIATRLLAQDKNNELARLVQGIKSFKDRAFTAAKPNLTASSGNVIGKLVSGLILAWANQGLGDTDGALATIASLNGPAWYEVYKNYNRGLIADVAGRRADAVKWMKDAYDADSGTLRNVEAYARILARSGNSAAAQKVLLDYTARGSEHPIIAALLREIGAGKTPSPIVSNSAEGAAEALYAIALALVTDGGNDQSAIYLQLALYLNPNADLAKVALGAILQDQQNAAKAAAIFRTVSEDSVMRPTAVIGVAVNLDSLKSTDEAVAQLQKLLAKSPNDLEAAITLGTIYRTHDRFEDATKAFSAGIATIKTATRTHWRIYYLRAIAYERQKRWPLAEADFKTALELFPNQPQVLNYLGYSWVDMGMNLDEGMAMIQKAVELRPDDGYIVDSLGWAYYRLGRYADAVRELERAVQLKAEDSNINDHLGDAYWQVGRKLEATFQWNHARDLGPEPADLPQILKKLQAGLPANASNKG